MNTFLCVLDLFKNDDSLFRKPAGARAFSLPPSKGPANEVAIQTERLFAFYAYPIQTKWLYRSKTSIAICKKLPLYFQWPPIPTGGRRGNGQSLSTNVFMSFHEQIWLQSCPCSFKPLLYRRYVDNCFLFFRSLSHVPLFLDYLNQQLPNTAFTSEVEMNGKLPFLDIDICRSQGTGLFHQSQFPIQNFTFLQS